MSLLGVRFGQLGRKILTDYWPQGDEMIDARGGDEPVEVLVGTRKGWKVLRLVGSD